MVTRCPVYGDFAHPAVTWCSGYSGPSFPFPSLPLRPFPPSTSLPCLSFPSLSPLPQTTVRQPKPNVLSSPNLLLSPIPHTDRCQLCPSNTVCIHLTRRAFTCARPVARRRTPEDPTSCEAVQCGANAACVVLQGHAQCSCIHPFESQGDACVDVR
ncbi:unnamed protein product [Closterium sp. NIES-54]